jgi:hypothetical protein
VGLDRCQARMTSTPTASIIPGVLVAHAPIGDQDVDIAELGVGEDCTSVRSAVVGEQDALSGGDDRQARPVGARGPAPGRPRGGPVAPRPTAAAPYGSGSICKKTALNGSLGRHAVGLPVRRVDQKVEPDGDVIEVIDERAGPIHWEAHRSSRASGWGGVRCVVVVKASSRARRSCGNPTTGGGGAGTSRASCDPSGSSSVVRAGGGRRGGSGRAGGPRRGPASRRPWRTRPSSGTASASCRP